MERLKSHREFVAVLRHRRRVSSRDIVLHYRMRAADERAHGNVGSDVRVGLAVSKAVGNAVTRNAVTRNAVKRRFRVLARRYEHELPGQCDIVLRAKPSAAGAQFASLDAQMAQLFRAVHTKTDQSAGQS